jgi:hypothetical protein
VAHKIGRLDPHLPPPPGRIGGSCPQCARIKKGSAPTRTTHHTSQMANSQISRSIGAPRPKDQNLRLPPVPIDGGRSRSFGTAIDGKCFPYEYGSPALSDRPQKQSPGGFPLPLGHARPHPPTAENRLWRDARFRRARSACLLSKLPVQPFDRDQRRSMARRCQAVRYRAPVHTCQVCGKKCAVVKPNFADAASPESRVALA